MISWTARIEGRAVVEEERTLQALLDRDASLEQARRDLFSAIISISPARVSAVARSRVSEPLRSRQPIPRLGQRPREITVNPSD